MDARRRGCSDAVPPEAAVVLRPWRPSPSQNAAALTPRHGFYRSEGGCRGTGREGSRLPVATGSDGEPGGLRDLLPGSGEVRQRLGDHDPVLVLEPLDTLVLGRLGD